MSDAAIDHIITLLFVAVVFLMICAYAGKSMDFQNRCEAACGVSKTLTPIMDLQETCLCDEGQGKWRRQEISR